MELHGRRPLHLLGRGSGTKQSRDLFLSRSPGGAIGPRYFGASAWVEEQGITLVLSLVLLASVTLISFALSALILREIQGARLTLRTEPAISAANSGGEIGLYRFFRQVGGATPPSGSLPQSQATFSVIEDLYDDPYVFGTNAASGGQAVVALFDASNLNNAAANYGEVTIFNDSASSIISYEVFSWSDPVNAVCQGTIGSSSSAICGSLSHPTDDRYLVVIQVTSGPLNITGRVRAKDNFLNPRGIPSDEPRLNSTGRNAEVQRKIEISF